MPFDLAQAKADGVSEDQILQHLVATRGFDVASALKDGATKDQIITYLTSTPPKSAAPKQSVSERAAANQNPNSPGNQLSNRVIAQAGQDESNLYGRFAKDAALTVAAGVAAPFTGGMSLLPALATAAGAGATGSLVGIGAQKLLGSNETPKTAGDLAMTLGFDAGSFALGEGIGRGVGVVARKLLPNMAIHEAAKLADGRNTLLRMYDAGTTELRSQIADAGAKLGQPLTADINPVLELVDRRLTAIPKPTTATTTQFGGLSPTAQEALSNVTKDLAVANGKAVPVPLEEAIHSYHYLNQIAYPGTGLSAEEKVVFRDALGQLDGIIRGGLNQAGPQATALYDSVNATVKAEKVGSETAKLANFAIGKLIQAAGVPIGTAGAGGAIGYAVGGKEGAETGAALGALGGAVSPAVSALVLKKVFESPNAAPMMKQAVDLLFAGKDGPAQALATRAITVAGGRQWIRHLNEEMQNGQPGPVSQTVLGAAPQQEQASGAP